MVSGIKKGRAVRLCRNFKVTVNPALKVDWFPLPQIDDIFASLSRGKWLSKIDMSYAYLKMEGKEDSKESRNFRISKGLYQW